jgi:hypothetical protein
MAEERMPFSMRNLLSVVVLSLLGMAASAQGAPGQSAAIKAGKEVHARHSNALFQNPRVVATGVGINPAGNPVIKVYLANGPADGLPETLDGLPVEVSISGKLSARRGNCNNTNADPQACKPDQPFAPPGAGEATDRYDRPVPIGVSTGHTSITAGTIGCTVQIGCHRYALSNNHVFANEGLAAIGDDILQPGPFDDGTAPDDVIGTLHDYEAIDFAEGASNVMDAALMAADVTQLGTATLPDGYGLPRSEPVEATPGMAVKKYGRTTGFTSGTIDAISVTARIGYDTGTARFVDQIVIKPAPFSAGGDSGSLIVVNGGADDRRPVGLLFAGSNAVTIANPIGPILTRFNATIIGE